MAKRNNLRREYYKKTERHWKTLTSTAKPTIEYCKWLEEELLTAREQVKNNVALDSVISCFNHDTLQRIRGAKTDAIARKIIMEKLNNL